MAAAWGCAAFVRASSASFAACFFYFYFLVCASNGSFAASLESRV